ncbi:methyltransferase family protein [Parafilimonas sp.]|uniref:methyltransferase family protein n=1 Tax=Parafilimonas sp. TaxID=1969739 RepID=UPI0039E4C9DE
MKKILTAVINIIIIIIMPLLFKPQLIFHYKIIIIEIVVFALWLTQPEFSMQETKQEKEGDKFSVLLILIMSIVSVVVPVIDWAYFKNELNHFYISCWIGVVFIILGIWIRVWAIMQLGNFFTPTVQIKEGHDLIILGPYAIVRHPSYLGAFLCITSGALILDSFVGYLIACIAMGIAYYFRIKVEEQKLIAYFGESYITYKKRTKAIIPFIL